jgi:hypothetical protein
MKETKLNKEINYYIDNYHLLFKSKYFLIVIILYIVHILAISWIPYIILTTIFNYKNKFWDKLVAIMLLIISFHWFSLKNECVISLIEKKMINKNYKMGTLCSLHPGLAYAGKLFKYNPYKYEIKPTKKYKILRLFNNYINPVITTIILSKRNNFFNNFKLWSTLNIIHALSMSYQYSIDEVIQKR